MYILFDIGGTNMRVAASRDGNTIDEVLAVETPADFEEGIAALASTAEQVAGDTSVTAAAGGFPGSFGRRGGTPYGAPNLPAWTGKSLREELKERFGAPVSVLNDADIAALGEAVYGAGQEYRIVAYLTISTGVGGGRVVDGNIDAYRFGLEPGHQVIDAGRTTENKGMPQTLEDCIGGASIQEYFGKPAKDVTDPAVWEKSHRLLAVGLINVIRLWSPDAIVLGGGQVLGGSIGVAEVERIVREDFAAFLPSSPDALPSTFTEAQLGGEAGLWGALALLGRQE